MGKITPRFFLSALITGLFLLSGNLLLAKITYGPERPVLKEKQQKHLFFVGFYLDAAPTITAPIDITVSSDSGQCFTSISNFNLGSPQTTGGGDITKDAPNQFPLGSTTITWTITNEEGTDSDTQIITVTDNEEPVITHNGNQNLNNDPGTCGALFTATASATDNCGVGSPTGTRSDGLALTAAYPVGKTTITWEVTDANNNNAAAVVQTIIVTDNEQPVITHNGDQNLNNGPGTCGASFTATASATDNCSVGSPTGTRSDGLALTAAYPVGSTTITWNVTDANSNNAAPITQTIIVTDNEKPVITHNGDQNLNNGPGTCGASFTATASATDNCSVGSPTGTRSDGLALTAAYPVGSTTITWNVTDANSNNAAPITQTIIVTDNEKPVITHNGDQNLNNDPGTCGASFTATASATDNCSVGSPTGTRSDGLALTAAYPVGTTTITWNVTDANNNNATPINQTITVTDNEKPVLPTLNNITWGCAYTVQPPVAMDNCDGEIVGVPNRSTTFTETGTITWVFTDASKNSKSFVQTVTINQIELNVEVEDILCNGYASGGAQAIVTGGIAPITYDWGALGNGTTKDGLSPGTYSVTATDVNGCTANRDFTISEPASFIEITNININKGCFEENNASVSVSAQGGTGVLSYNWSNAKTGAIIDNINNSASSNELTLTITDENGCSIEETITVYPPEKLEITNIVATETNTFGSATGTATAIIEGGTANFEFAWSNGQTGQTAKNLAAGTYTVLVTDANGCTAQETVTVIDPLETSMIPTSKCLSEEGGLRTSTFQVDSVQGGIAPYNYKWDFGGETVEFSATNNKTDGPGVHVVNYLAGGIYPVSLTVTDSVGNEYTEIFNHYVGECFEPCGQTQNIDFTLDTFYIGKEDSSPLQGSECDTYTGKRYIYLRIEQNANAYNPSVEFIYSISQGGVFLSEERITGCIDIGDEKIPDLLRIGEVQNWSCGNSITLESFYMDWTNNSQKKCGDVRQRMCISTNENDEIHFPLSARIEKTNNFCHGDKQGVIEIIPNGGVGIYHYELQNIATNEVYGPKDTRTFNTLPAGTYKAMVHDDNETYTVNNIVISQPDNELLLKEKEKTPLLCFGGNNATATVEASGGTAPYTIVWDHISQTSTETTGTANNLSAGTYSVNVVDANGCDFSTQVTINQPEELIANAGVDQALECGVNQVNLGGVFEGYTNPITGVAEFGNWQIINGPSGAVISEPNNPESLFTITSTGTYTLEWTIPCGSSDRVKIVFSNCSTIDFDGIDDHIDFGKNLNLSTGFTLEAWIKQDQNATGTIKTILSKRNNANLGIGGYDLIIENNTPKFRWNNQTISSDYQIDSNRWYHIAVIQGGIDEGIYIDGIKASESVPGIPNNIDRRFLIGAMHDDTSQPLPTHFFHGWIEEVRVWNTSLELDQLKFMMNQRIINNNATNVKGEIIPLEVPNNLKWENLTGYYRLITSEATNGVTKNKVLNGIDGRLKNIQSTQQNTAPLPYIAVGGDWWNSNSWKQPQVWDPPNSTSIKNKKINWNIARLDGKTLTNPSTSDNSNSITLLGLLDDGGSLIMNGANNTSGNELRITHYLGLNGHIDLNGESQLIQTEGSQIAGTGDLERDQQGTSSSFNYNYWSSPVLPNSRSSTYKVNNVLYDGSTVGTNVFKTINFEWPHTHADGAKANPIKISDYWINTFRARTANEYSQWEQIGSYTALKPGEGYTMKGTENIDISQGKLQNYTFNGFPNNGTIEVSEIRPGQNYLLGNPYPSSISVEEFILDNIRDGEGRSTQNLLNGALYFWDHFGGKTHYLARYVGGYAVRNLLDGVPAISNDARINATGEEGDKRPGAYVPVAQGFFVNTTQDAQAGSIDSFDIGEIIFKNSQRYYRTEIKDVNGESISVFMESKNKVRSSKKTNSKAPDNRYKIRLKFNSPTGYHREISVGADSRTSQGFDLGFDAPLIDRGPEDMYWMIGEKKYVIQGVPHFNLDQKLPIGLKVTEEKEFSIEIGTLVNLPDIIDIYLRDNSDSTYHNLRKEAFKASLPPGEYQDLYEIVFHDVTSTRKDKEPGEGPIDYYYSLENREFVISNPELHKIEHINIYNIAGQLVDQHFGIPDIKKIVVPQKKSLSSAVYIVKIYTSAGDYAKKVIIRKN